MLSPFSRKYFFPWASGGDSCQEVTSERNTAVEYLALEKWQSFGGPVLAWAKWEVSCIFRDPRERRGTERGSAERWKGVLQENKEEKR